MQKAVYPCSRLLVPLAANSKPSQPISFPTHALTTSWGNLPGHPIGSLWQRKFVCQLWILRWVFRFCPICLRRSRSAFYFRRLCVSCLKVGSPIGREREDSKRNAYRFLSLNSFHSFERPFCPARAPTARRAMRNVIESRCMLDKFSGSVMLYKAFWIWRHIMVSAQRRRAEHW